MAHIDDRVIELARTALSFEYGEEHFYRHAAEMIQNPKGKAMFLRLAQEEPGHMDDMHRLFGAIIGKEEWQRLVAEEAANAHPSKVIAEMEAAIAHRGMIAVADDTQALRMAMELERRAIHLLKDMADHTQDPAIIELIGKMIMEECSQYDALQAQLDSVLNVGLWLDMPEFRMDGKY
ncbi:MAG: ferritin family protein [Betaproteobacteria bacterium]|nr:ferritin family protein [Betaproteobacteria bacterium]